LYVGSASVNASRTCNAMMACRVGRQVDSIGISTHIRGAPANGRRRADFWVVGRTYIYAFLSEDLGNFGMLFNEFRNPE